MLRMRRVLRSVLFPAVIFMLFITTPAISQALVVDSLSAKDTTFTRTAKITGDSATTVDTTASTFWTRRTIAKIGTATLAGGTFAYGWSIWWKKGFRAFKIHHEDCYTHNICIDKIGHMYFSYFTFNTINSMLKWGGLTDDESLWWAAGVAAFHALATETGDGFGYGGADPEDLAFNWTGIGFGILRKKVPFFANFELKWSLYYPLQRHQFLIHQLQDYHIYWMSARVNNLLPESWRDYWPDFLQIALGFSGWSNSYRREYILGFDYNLEHLIPFEGRDINLVKKILNMFHAPAPGVKFAVGRKPEYVLLLLN